MFPRGIYTETPPLDESNDGAKLGRKKNSRNSLQKFIFKTRQNATTKISRRDKSRQNATRG